MPSTRTASLRMTAMAVAVLGLFAAHRAQAEEFNIATFGTSVTKNLSTNSLDLIYSVDNNAADSNSAASTLRLSSGVSLTGQNISGVNTQQGLAVFSRQVRDFIVLNAPVTDQYSLANSTLVLEGNNSISGLVGVRVNLDGNTSGNFYGSYTADPLARIEVNGPNVVFNRPLFADNIDLNQGASVEFLGQLGDASHTTVLDYKGNNATVTLRGGQTLFGSVVNSTALLGDKTNGSLILSGSGTFTGAIGGADSGLSLIRLDGSGSTVLFGGNVTADHLDYQASSTVTVQGSLRMNTDAAMDARHQVSFNQTDGVLTLVGGGLAGVAGASVVTTTVDGRGTLVFTGTGAEQTVTGQIGAQGLRIKRFDIGDPATQNAASLTVDGDIFAATVSLNNDGATTHSRLTLASGRSITAGALSTDANGMGQLILAGGTQNVAAPVGSANSRLSLVRSGATGGAATFDQSVFANTVENSGTGTNLFRGTVNASTVNVANGASTFEQAVTANDVMIGAGSGNFQQSLGADTLSIGTGAGTFSGSVLANASVAIGAGTGTFDAALTSPTTSIAGGVGTFNGTTSTNLAFTGAGTAHLNQGLTGTVAFAGQNAVVNLADGQSISGAISTTVNNTGVLNVLGDATLSAAVGASGAGINRLNVNTVGQNTQNGLLAQGSLWAGQTLLNNGGTLTLNPGVNLTGTDPSIPALATDAPNTGALRLLGASTITGGVGENGKAVGRIDATGTAPVIFDGAVYAGVIDVGVQNKPATFKGTVQAGEMHVGGAPGLPGIAVTLQEPSQIGLLRFRDDGLVRVEKGLTGTVDFNGKWGELRLADGVNLDTALTPFINASEGVLRFEGNSVVTGPLGTAVTDATPNPTDRLSDVYAGANGKVVTFTDDVRLSSTTLHVEGTGTVNLQGNLYGPLQYDADGLVNVSDSKQIVGLTTTLGAGTGRLNFVGSATTAGQIGSAALPLGVVNFHGPMGDARAATASPDAATVSIGHNVYSALTTVGHPSANDPATTLNISETGLFLGNALTLGPNVTLNTAGTFGRTTITGRQSVTVGHSLNADGTLGASVAARRSQTGTGAISTGGATMNFVVGAQAWDAVAGGGRLAVASSSSVTGAAGSSLSMTGSETVNIALLGSLRNGATISLIDTAVGANQTTTGNVYDNSYVIDTALSRGTDGDLVLTVARDADTYVTKSGTAGHVSNAAARRLGALAASGEGYGADLQAVINRLDLDPWGYGADADSLAVQIKRLAPIANRSYDKAALNGLSAGIEHIGTRLKDLRTVEYRADPKPYSLWVRNGVADARLKPSAEMDGYEHRYRGFALGTDSRVSSNLLAGAALSFGRTQVEQMGFRQGDAGTVETLQLTAYGSYDFNDRIYADGLLSGARQSVQGSRAAALDRIASFDFASRGAHALKFNLGYRMHVPNSTLIITPMISAEEGRSTMKAHEETGAGDIGLAYGVRKLRKSETGIGFRLNGTQQFFGYVLRPELALMRVQDRLADETDQVTAKFIGDTSGSFVTPLTQGERNSTRLQLGLGWLLSKTAALSVRYQRDQEKDYRSNRAELMLRWDH